MKFRDAAFLILVCLFLCGPTMLCIAAKANIDLPSQLTAESTKYLSGGIAKSELRANLNIEGFQNKKLQAAIEDKVKNYIPARAGAMLGNAALQRNCIAISSALFSQTCYESYFKSERLYNPSTQALGEMPFNSSKAKGNIESLASGLADIAEEFPEKEFVVIVADRISTSKVNPAIPLLPNTYTTEMAIETFQSVSADTPNIFIPDTTYQDPARYYFDFYRTDHHWNGWGAICAYRESLDCLNPEKVDLLLEPISSLEPLTGLEWLEENGSFSRSGLMMLNEKVSEPHFPFTDINFENGNIPIAFARNSIDEMKQVGPLGEYDFYKMWYGAWTDTTVLNEDALMPDSSALIICDSYGSAFRWAASTDFGKVTTHYDLVGDRKEAESLRNQLANNSSNVIFLVACVQNYQNILERIPNYLD